LAPNAENKEGQDAEFCRPSQHDRDNIARKDVGKEIVGALAPKVSGADFGVLAEGNTFDEMRLPEAVVRVKDFAEVGKFHLPFADLRGLRLRR
jgi:hypothetical protein